MSREWKPGDVALVTSYERPVLAMVRHRTTSSPRLMFAYPDGVCDIVGDPDVAARPLLVIDPEDREQVERLSDAFCNARWSHLPGSDECDPLTRSSMQAALRSLLAPPKPEEPLGLGAVVEDDGGRRWIRLDAADEPWSRCDPLSDSLVQSFAWSDLDVVRVLADGYTEGER